MHLTAIKVWVDVSAHLLYSTVVQWLVSWSPRLQAVVQFPMIAGLILSNWPGFESWWSQLDVGVLVASNFCLPREYLPGLRILSFVLFPSTWRHQPIWTMTVETTFWGNICPLPANEGVFWTPRTTHVEYAKQGRAGRSSWSPEYSLTEQYRPALQTLVLLRKWVK